MKKVFNLTNKYIVIATPLILFSLISSIYLTLSAAGKIINLIIAIVLFTLMLGAFIAGWFNMIKLAVKEPYRDDPNSLIKEFTPGVGEYFLSSLGSVLVITVVSLALIFVSYYAGMKGIGDPGISANAFSDAMSSTEALKAFLSSLTTEQLNKLNLWNFLLLGTISLSQLVYDFGVTQNQYTINKLDWEMSKQNVESVVNQVVCDVKDAYYNLLYALSTKQVRQETVEQYQQMYDQAKAFYEIGTRPRVDVTIASSNLADARANFIEASNAVDLAVSKLNNVMGTPFIDPYVVDTSMPYQPTDITMKQAIEIANKARPDLKTALYQIQRAEQNVKLYKKSYMPSLSVGANLSMGGRHNFVDNTWYDFGGYFSFPIINPVLITSQIKQAKAELEQQKFDTKNSVNDIYYEIQSAFVRVTDTSQRIVASKLAVQEARESYELSQGRYKAGVCDAIELKEAQISYENAKLAYISNIYEYNSAKAALEMAIGQSIKPSEVQENVEI